jgi:hypothetical protein
VTTLHRLALHVARIEDDPRRQAQALARESQRLSDGDRAMVVHLARRLDLPLTPLLQTWAALDAARRAA